MAHASSTQMEQGSSSNTVEERHKQRERHKGNGEGGRGISRGRGNVAQAPIYPNSQESVHFVIGIL
ncbi:hypothetical protein Prudu_009102 [Prunus dulcis]|uniref:Uncharacterized protein n=1 Tax=Prunus dulcis TaxID=3755 RepID=A0A4Y1R601_PRUDU|nr:hypothetical protein Prudu_009102 [Prunus dulcis]